MDAYENYSLEGILRNWSMIKKEKGITLCNEVNNIFVFLNGEYVYLLFFFY